MIVFRLVSAIVTAIATVQAAQNSLQQVTGSFGTNPTGVGFYYYKPSRLANAPRPAIVAIHWCHGSAQDYFTGTQYATLADTYGFIVLYPNSPHTADHCFDVASAQTLSHNAGGDSQGIASMVSYAISNWGVDPSRVYVTGTSSGAMMTNVMVGSYPNLFAAASIYSGVPFACFEAPGVDSLGWNAGCATGQVNKSASQWGDIVRAAYPGYNGPRPKMMIWHGTADNVLYYSNYGQEILEWTNVFGLSSTPTTTDQNDPQTGYTRTTYGCQIVGYSAAGVGHTVPVHEAIDLAFFGITGSVSGIPISGCGTTKTSSTTTKAATTTTTTTRATSATTTQTTTTAAGGATQTHWGQCGGQGYSGPTNCAPYNCVYANAWYSQCL